MKGVVLDASALMAFLEDRPGADQVEELLAKAAYTRHPLLMSVVNWGEVYYAVWRARGQQVANAKLEEIAQLPIELVEVDQGLAQTAAALKIRHNLPYVDCFAAALALVRKAAVVTSDRDFARLARAVPIVWL